MVRDRTNILRDYLTAIVQTESKVIVLLPLPYLCDLVLGTQFHSMVAETYKA